MRHRWSFFWFLALLPGAPGEAIGQRLYGVAYDSLTRAPLSGALVVATASRTTAITDSAGRFVLEGLPIGRTVMVTLAHDALDSLGLGALSRRVVLAGNDTIRLAVPSFATIWANACPGRPPSDSGVMFGVVRDAASGQVVPAARVAATWVDLSYGTLTGLKQQRRRMEVIASDMGAFGFCGLPAHTMVTMQAGTDSAASGIVSATFGAARVARRDLLVGARDNSATGTIVGVALDQRGQPVANARVSDNDAREARTTDSGTFQMHRVPAGTRQLEVTAIGMRPAAVIVDVRNDDTAHVAVQLMGVATLDPVHVTAPAFRQRLVAQFNERRSMGIGVFKDSSTLRNYGKVITAIRDARSVTIIRDALIYLPGNKPGGCLANVWIDGQRSDQEEFLRLRPDELAAIEVYSRISSTPSEFIVREPSRTGRSVDRGLCGSIVVWTKRAFP